MILRPRESLKGIEQKDLVMIEREGQKLREMGNERQKEIEKERSC